MRERQSQLLFVHQQPHLFKSSCCRPCRPAVSSMPAGICKCVPSISVLNPSLRVHPLTPPQVMPLLPSVLRIPLCVVTPLLLRIHPLTQPTHTNWAIAPGRDSPGGRDCLSLSAFSASCTHRVYRYLLRLTLNLVTPARVFLIFTDRASFWRAASRNCLISVICFGCTTASRARKWGKRGGAHNSSFRGGSSSDPAVAALPRCCPA